jgi:hypothetical protein
MDWTVADTEATYKDQHGNTRYRVVFRGSSCEAAESYVADIAHTQPDKVFRGAYEICGPEGRM